MKVFIADDSKIFRDRLKEMLSELTKVEIIGEAEGALETIKRIRKLNPDVVILDIRMPDGSGIDILKHIKKNNQAPAVIILTNYPYPQYRKKCMELGADYFFKKSDEIEEVLEALKQLIQDFQ